MPRHKYDLLILAILLHRDTREKAVQSRVIREIISTIFMIRKPYLAVIERHLNKLANTNLITSKKTGNTKYWYITIEGQKIGHEKIMSEIFELEKKIDQGRVKVQGLKKCHEVGIEDYVFSMIERNNQSS